jgi:periplasmic copper chaperone A
MSSKFNFLSARRNALAKLGAITLSLFAISANAEKNTAEPSLKIFDVWAKTTVPGASVSAAYMHIKSGKPLKLVKAESPLTPTVEIHAMKMKDGVMEMKAVEAIDIPANKLVDLKPGGLHIMLIKINKPIKKGDKVPLKLTFERADKSQFTLEVSAEGKERDSHSHKH